MYDYADKSVRGTTPYTAPKVIIYEDKKFLYDSVGRVKAIVDNEIQYEKQVKDNKLKLITVVAVMIAVTLVCTILNWLFS